MAGADSGASKIYRKGATSYFSKGEQHALTKILRRNGLKPELKNYVVLQRLKAHFRSRDVPKT